MSNNLRTVLVSVLSMLVLIFWQIYFVKKEAPAPVAPQQNVQKLEGHDFLAAKDNTSQGEESKGARVIFQNGAITGSINLVGAKIDDLTLLRYQKTVQEDSEDVVLLSPVHTKEVYYAEFGWLSGDRNVKLPDNKTVWSADKHELKPNDKVKLTWKNVDGLRFVITITMDENYMFTIEQSVSGKQGFDLKPYAALSRGKHGNGESQMLIHEGGVGVFENKLQEVTFDDLNDKKLYKFSDANNGWFGFSDKYWLTAIIPEKSGLSARFIEYTSGQEQRYQADGVMDGQSLDGEANGVRFRFFAGAKELKLLDEYEQKYNIKLFDRAVDFGVLYFITKPIFLALNFFHSLVGNFGVAIILLTVFIKLLLFPLAYKGFKGMNRLKDLQPEMARLKKVCGDDNVKLQKAMVELYKKEKVNPVSGCLPLLLQMPVFFALYKVLYVTLEMRHAEFYGWINDLSALDPTNIFTLFGLIPWSPPSFLHIGVLPIVMSLTLFLQQGLNPQPTDPTQAKVMKLLPLIFLFMFASFPSGLVLYWSWSNILSIIQQILIKRITK
ncbi:membrane protein insertase YidC [Candidatus Bandiella euplotis]|uniref:Membrane protein insertase YidC n=1 Tax=Candidatus Bandiella euplotis TaxID=1664265 RepID=A0ABZ0UQQ4_9RICK|nr:membrane protein insertase YidC [Candidatus Bandiella woodruffii]WPX97048.1 Membrane protein insertase YidC [Candidatus Bandiella woodruffii]